MKIDVTHLDDLALGSVFLATGGGGDPHVPLLIAEQVLAKLGPVDVIAPEDLAECLCRNYWWRGCTDC